MGVITARSERDKHSGWPPPKAKAPAPEQPVEPVKRRGRPPKVKANGDNT
jgi:hypothetical protein